MNANEKGRAQNTCSEKDIYFYLIAQKKKKTRNTGNMRCISTYYSYLTKTTIK